MSTFGLYGEFPFSFGGEDSDVEAEHMAMLDALAPGWDVSDGTEVYDEAFAHAAAVSVIWACNERLRNQGQPLRMLEALTDWEEACGLRPSEDDLDVDRRSALAAKLRGLAGNTLTDITDVCTEILGTNFSALVTVADTNVIVYWPGGPTVLTPGGTAVASAPGPPGLEWASNRSRIAVRMTKDGLSDAEFNTRRASLARELDAICPSWMSFAIGVGSSFTVNLGVVGQTLL